MSENEETNATLLGEIEQGPSKLDQFLDKNQKKLIIAGIAAVLIVAGYIISRGMQENKGLASSADFMNADSAGAYQAVADSQSGTPAGGSALIALANAQWENGAQAESIQTLKSFVDQYGDHAAYPAGLINLAGKLTRTGEISQANSFLEEVLELEDPTFSPVAQYLLAEIKTVAGDTDGAVAQLEGLTSMPSEELGRLKSLASQNLKFAQSPVPAIQQPQPLPESPETVVEEKKEPAE